MLRAAHPETARVMVVALPGFGATRAVIHRARAMGCAALIVARAQRAETDAKLRAEGATAVIVSELAGALALLQETLLVLDLPHEHVFTGLRVLQRPTFSTLPRNLKAPQPTPSTGAPSTS